jgi:hypothetical protein
LAKLQAERRETKRYNLSGSGAAPFATSRDTSASQSKIANQKSKIPAPPSMGFFTI